MTDYISRKIFIVLLFQLNPLDISLLLLAKITETGKGVKKKIERLEKSLKKYYNDSVREKIWQNIEKFKKELDEMTK